MFVSQLNINRAVPLRFPGIMTQNIAKPRCVCVGGGGGVHDTCVFPRYRGGYRISTVPVGRRRVQRSTQGSLEFEWGFYALSAPKAIFRVRTYNCITYSVR